MEDVQSMIDDRGIKLDQVGIRKLKYPIYVLKKESNVNTKNVVQCPSIINVYVDLPSKTRGTHMSRFIEEIIKHENLISLYNMDEITKSITKKLNAESAIIDIKFMYFIEKKAPASKISSLMGYDCRFFSAYKAKQGNKNTLEVKVPVTILCPCSKEISDYGAHNQRAIIKAQVKDNGSIIWIEDLVDLLESCGSAQIYSLLKRPDEKYITERAYDNPLFVEDVVRNAARKLLDDNRVSWFNLSAESIESIHDHNAFAQIEIDKSDVLLVSK